MQYHTYIQPALEYRKHVEFRLLANILGTRPYRSHLMVFGMKTIYLHLREDLLILEPVQFSSMFKKKKI